ncbi:MAG: thymidine phosphorylase [Actinomycetota bacterium]
MSYSMPELIGTKREGGALAAEELRWIIAEYTADRLPDYQLSAFLMAVIFRGMSQDELAAWTDAMLHSGDVLDLSATDIPKIDKHSTGGVGDKISIPLAPLVAACGIGVPMMSGRGLGHTGGTLDKLESIPGFRTRLDPDEFARQFDRLGIVLAGQSETLVPADRRIYALRDASGTVPAIPLISSSIMSKKLAEDLDGLVLDVKIGSGAFMKDVDSGTELAETMVGIGRSHDTPVVGILTDMDQPLGKEVGNANEMVESIAVLRGEGPDDVTELTMLLGAEMLVLGGVASDTAEARSRLEATVSSGAGLDVFEKTIVAHGGDPRVLEDTTILPSAEYEHTVTADHTGNVERCDALTVGRSAVRLGAGRRAKADEVDPGVGITVLAKVGDSVAAGDPLATIRYNTEAQLNACVPVLETAWTLTDEPQSPRPLILGEVR